MPHLERKSTANKSIPGSLSGLADEFLPGHLPLLGNMILLDRLTDNGSQWHSQWDFGLWRIQPHEDAWTLYVDDYGAYPPSLQTLRGSLPSGGPGLGRDELICVACMRPYAYRRPEKAPQRSSAGMDGIAAYCPRPAHPGPARTAGRYLVLDYGPPEWLSEGNFQHLMANQE